MWEGFRLALQFLTRLQVHTEGATARDAAVSYYFYPAIVTAQILGRWAFLPLGYFSVNAHEGLGSEFAKRIDANTVVVTTVFSGAVVILMSRIFGALAFCVAIIIVASAARYFRRRIGGVTGDCFGATFQFVEMATYAAFLT